MLWYNCHANIFFLLYVSRLYDYASALRNAILTTMNETRVSLPSLIGLSPHLSRCHESTGPLLCDRGLESLVAGLACFLVAITIHSHKAALCPFNVTNLL